MLERHRSRFDALSISQQNVTASPARWRSQVVRYGRPAPDGTALEREASPRAAGPTHAWSWAALTRRVFCGGRPGARLLRGTAARGGGADRPRRPGDFLGQTP